MGHHLEAFLGADEAIDALMAECALPHIARLPFGLSLVPLDVRFISDEEARDPPRYPAELIPFEAAAPDPGPRGGSCLWIEGCVAQIAAHFARSHPIVYLRTDWFGGQGDSGAWLFSPGDAGAVGAIERFDDVNQALARLGVLRGARGDAWEAIGLDHYRRSDWDDWDRRRDAGHLVHTRELFALRRVEAAPAEPGESTEALRLRRERTARAIGIAVLVLAALLLATACLRAF